MDLRQIENIVAIEQEQSISKAAERLFLTQSALNQQLLRLEKELGIQLFERKKHAMIPTFAGKVYLATAHRMIDMKKETYKIIHDISNETAGEISVAYSPERGSLLFSHIYPTFRRRYPNVTFSIHEAHVKKMETMLLPLIDNQTDPTIATYAKEGECSLRIASKRPTLADAQKAVADMEAKVLGIIGDFVYSCDDEELIEVVGKLLIEKNISVSCAESCTGGLFAGALTDIPGISAVFERGIVTYSNRAKMEELGVSAETLERFGAVSPETAVEMADGLQKKTGSDLCVSVTGIAGPGGGTEEKPVGLVYIGIAYNGKTEAIKSQYRNVNRRWNRNYAVLNMLWQIYKRIR